MKKASKKKKQGEQKTVEVEKPKPKGNTKKNADKLSE